MEGQNGLVGLSPGNRVDPDFYEADMSEYGECMQQIPLAFDGSLMMSQGTTREITLHTIDDGLPDPPALLTTVITKLPAEPLYDAQSGGIITEADLPHPLADGGACVRYRPSPTFFGTDSFEFIADDGEAISTMGVFTIAVERVLPLPFLDIFESFMLDPVRWSTIVGASVDIGTGSINPPSAPFTLRINGNGGIDGSDEIQSALMNLADATSATASYWYQRTGNGNPTEEGDDLFFEFFDLNGEWVLLDTQLGEGPDMTEFEQVSIALPAEAFHDMFRIRFRNIASRGSFDDWFVDDVRVEASLNCVSDVDASGVVDFNDLVHILFDFGPCD